MPQPPRDASFPDPRVPVFYTVVRLPLVPHVIDSRERRFYTPTAMQIMTLADGIKCAPDDVAEDTSMVQDVQGVELNRKSVESCNIQKWVMIRVIMQVPL